MYFLDVALASRILYSFIDIGIQPRLAFVGRTPQQQLVKGPFGRNSKPSTVCDDHASEVCNGNTTAGPIVSSICGFDCRDFIVFAACENCLWEWVLVRKRYYIFFVTRDAEGEIRKIPIPLHYAYVFLAGAVIGMFTITGMAGSYARMLVKTATFNEIRQEKNILQTRYHQLEQVTKEKDIQVASLGSLASEVSSLYGLKSDSILTNGDPAEFTTTQYNRSLDQLYTLRTSAMNGAATAALGFGDLRNATTADWMRLAAAPTLWPVEGAVTGSFGERVDPFNGEGAFHSGVDISSTYGHPVIAPAYGVVDFADNMNDYGKMITLDHGHGITTRFGHLSAFIVAPGERVHKGDIIGYVGMSGRATGPHLHYEVRIYGTPVNPYKFLRTTLSAQRINATGM